MNIHFTDFWRLAFRFKTDNKSRFLKEFTIFQALPNKYSLCFQEYWMEFFFTHKQFSPILFSFIVDKDMSQHIFIAVLFGRDLLAKSEQIWERHCSFLHNNLLDVTAELIQV